MSLWEVGVHSGFREGKSDPDFALGGCDRFCSERILRFLRGDKIYANLSWGLLRFFSGRSEWTPTSQRALTFFLWKVGVDSDLPEGSYAFVCFYVFELLSSGRSEWTPTSERALTFFLLPEGSCVFELWV